MKRLRLCQTGEALASVIQDSGDGLSSSSLSCGNPNPFPAGALQQNQQDALIPSSAASAVRPNVTMQEISFWTMSPADDLPEASCHDAENFSRKVLCVREVPVRKDIEHLFSLLPHEKPSRGNGQGCSFSCGMFAQGPLWFASGKPSLSFVMPGLDCLRPSVCAKTCFHQLELVP